MEFRHGRLTVDDPVFGRLELEGDGFSAAGELATLATVPQVQQRLGVGPEHAEEIRRIVAGYRDDLARLHREPRHPIDERVAELREAADARITALLGDRAYSAKALSWRVRNGDALLDDDVADALGLTTEQRDSLLRIRAENRRASSASMRDTRHARFATASAFEARAADAHTGDDERLLSVLTPAQRDRFERMKEG